MNSAFDYIIIGLIILGLVFFLKPSWFDASAGKVIEGVKDRVNVSMSAVKTDSQPEKIEMPFLYDNLTFVLCTSDNICERLYGASSFCNTSDGYCYRH